MWKSFEQKLQIAKFGDKFYFENRAKSELEFFSLEAMQRVTTRRVTTLSRLTPGILFRQPHIITTSMSRHFNNVNEDTKASNSNPTKKGSTFWKCKHTWRRSAINTGWCLLGCSVGDFGTMLLCNNFFLDWSLAHPMSLMCLSTVNGLLTSVLLETIILYRQNKKKANTQQLSIYQCLQTAANMSMLSMLAMECAMNVTDFCMVGTMAVTWYSVVPSLMAGFLVPWPYNYWKLKKFGKACH
ncbi:hypothetical protein RFI_29261 [Reticulomyxa filosa]|uniref:DUF4396 domain-containing protein n=1 Tax=Reticulomyxa filosa TaxID=46433 RepID=X6M3T1_RETFI|nr:hypothetical protein RFI_29261 [Reticulomyxa filosa]|eukprot:ETO08127.1 hypothetical protein RFI_29261 [Reticulomyxa filosa]